MNSVCNSKTSRTYIPEDGQMSRSSHELGYAWMVKEQVGACCEDAVHFYTWVPPMRPEVTGADMILPISRIFVPWKIWPLVASGLVVDTPLNGTFSPLVMIRVTNEGARRDERENYARRITGVDSTRERGEYNE